MTDQEARDELERLRGTTGIETKEQFLTRYPNPNPEKRVLVQCECGYSSCTGWAWAYRNDIQRWETVVGQ